MNEIDWVATSAVVQAVAAVVMAAVTIVYVYLTYQLLKVQQRPLTQIRLQAQESSARSLLTAIGRARASVLPTIGRLFPVNISQIRTEGLFVRSDDFPFEEFNDFAVRVSTDPHLLPESLRQSCLNAAGAMLRLIARMLLLDNAILRARQMAGHADRQPTVDDVRSVYLTQMRSIALERPEWEELLDGSVAHAALDSVSALEQSLVEYLSGCQT